MGNNMIDGIPFNNSHFFRTEIKFKSAILEMLCHTLGNFRFQILGKFA